MEPMDASRSRLTLASLTAIALAAALVGCGADTDTPESAPTPAATEEAPVEEPAENPAANEPAAEEPADEPSEVVQQLPAVPQAFSAITVVGDESLLPAGIDGEVAVVAISEPGDRGTSFPVILHNGTDKPVSRIEVSGRAKGPDGATLGTGSSQTIEPNVVPPGGFAIGYVYISTSEYSLPPGSTVEDLRVQYRDGLGDFENIVTVNIENFEHLASGDFTGDAVNPHDIEVSA